MAEQKKPAPNAAALARQHNYSVSQYRNPTTPLQQRFGPSTQLVPAGTRAVYWSSEGGTENLIPVEDAYNLYGLMGEKARKKLFTSMDSFYGRGAWDPSWIPKFWGRAVNLSASALSLQNQKINPLDAFDTLVRDAAAYGVGPDGAGSGGGRGGGRATPMPSVNLTDPGTAETLVDQALQGYLGRKALPDERATFLKALRREEMANPRTVTVQGGKAVSGGGINPQAFAEDFAQAQEGAAEFTAATTLLDSFIQSLSNPVELT